MNSENQNGPGDQYSDIPTPTEAAAIAYDSAEALRVQELIAHTPERLQEEIRHVTEFDSEGFNRIIADANGNARLVRLYIQKYDLERRRELPDADQTIIDFKLGRVKTAIRTIKADQNESNT